VTAVIPANDDRKSAIVLASGVLAAVLTKSPAAGQSGKSCCSTADPRTRLRAITVSQGGAAIGGKSRLPLAVLPMRD